MAAIIPKLKDFDVDPANGFMRYCNFKGTYPEKLARWHNLAKESVADVQAKTLRAKIDQLPLIDHKNLSNEEKLYAYAALSFIGQCYLWQDPGEDLKNHATKIPQQLAVPWAGVAHDLGVKPCHTYVSTVIGNMELKDPTKPPSIENMKALYQLPGGFESEWFFIVSASTELEGAPGLRAVITAMEGVNAKNPQQVLEGLKGINQSILKVVERAFARMHDHLTPDTFYNVIRIYFNGWENVEFEGVDGGKKESCIGASAAQSPFIQCFDAALRIIHKKGQQEYLSTVRSYMLPKHQAFIQAVWDGPDIREFVQNQGSDELKAAYNMCVDAIVQFRSYHLEAVNKWIAKPATAKKAKEMGAAVGANEGEEEKGSGGMPIETFLGGIKKSADAFKL